MTHHCCTFVCRGASHDVIFMAGWGGVIQNLASYYTHYGTCVSSSSQ